MLDVFRFLVFGSLSIYVLATTPIFLFFCFRALFNLITALGCRAKDARWFNPVSWVTPQGYTREGYQDLAGFVTDVGKGLLLLVPWAVLLLLAKYW
jgi:hypothetical protein